MSLFPATIRCSLLNVGRGVLVQQVNCRGKMGKGLALALREQWPKVFEDYQLKFQSVGWRPGDAQFVQVASDIWVANLAGQDRYGREPGVVYTRYPDLGRALKLADNFAHAQALPLYVPYGLGCGLAGGDWETVCELLPAGTIVCRL